MPLANRHRHDVGCDSGRHHRRGTQRTVCGGNLDDVALPDAKSSGGGRIDLNPTTPHCRGQRIRHLLKPWQMRQRSIEERARRVRKEMKWILLWVSVELR